MLTEENVKFVKSEGASCFVCDAPILKGEPSIRVTFKLLVSVTKEMHAPACARDLRNLLDLRISEASR